MAVFAGVDGGGSKTRCVLTDEEGNWLGSSVSGPSNLPLVGQGTAAESLYSALRRASKEAGLSRIDALCLGLAGCGREESLTAARRVLSDVLARPGSPRCSLHDMVTDAEIALEGALAGSCGVVLISGTGSIALGRNCSGGRARAGGWGRILDDEGSSYDVGRRVLAEVMRGYDGRGNPTSLTGEVERLLGFSGPDELAVLSTAKEFGERIPQIAPLAFECARDGDATAARIVSGCARDLAEMVAAVARRLALDDFRLCCTGGMFKNPELAPSVSKELEKGGLGHSLAEPVLPPVGGALLLARRMKLRASMRYVERLAEEFVKREFK